MLISSRLATLVLASFLASFGCHAQAPAKTPAATKLETGATLPPAVAYRVEILLRGKAQLPPASTISIGPVEPSDIAGFHTINVTVTAEDKSSHPIKFLLSDDGKTVAQFIKYDISADPRTIAGINPEPKSFLPVCYLSPLWELNSPEAALALAK